MPAKPSKRAIKEFFSALGVTHALAQDPTLAKWALGYFNAAAAAGANLACPNYPAGMTTPLASTIKFICELRPYCKSATWLNWQRYGAPQGRGPWWVAEFSFPVKWIGATMILRDPADFTFAGILTAADELSAQFELYPTLQAAFPPAAVRRLARLILEEMRQEWDDTEFVLICREARRSLDVDIWHNHSRKIALELNRDLKPRKDADGIYWFTGRARGLDKSEASARSARADRFSWQDEDIQFVSDRPPKVAKRSRRRKK